MTHVQPDPVIGRSRPRLLQNAGRPSAPAGAPSVLVIMTDDVGFGAASTFGGPIPCPTFDALADDGLRYNSFHTTAMCSPSRASLLTGRNHHSVGTGTVADLGVDEPGYSSIIPQSCASIARVLGLNGYATAMFGKHHNTPDWEITSTGPYDRWPTGMGFDYYYGFFGGACDQNATPLIENTVLLDTPADADYNLDRDLADKAVDWMRRQHAQAPERPYLVYMAPGTAHSPHRAPSEWLARFRGQFDQGWDRLREETVARQKAAGIIPAGARLTPRPASLPAWDSLDRQAQEVAARMMETYAAMLAHWEFQLGRVIDELKRTGRYDNTLIFYLQGDNGASGEGTIAGTLSDTLNPDPTDMAYMHARLDEFGTRTTYQNYPSAWGWALDTPFQYTKQVASHFGGTRNGLSVTWPRRIRDRGQVRGMFTHIIDIAPTIYEAAGITPPDTVHGVTQDAIEGTSLMASFLDAAAPATHRSQYFEMVGNRGWYEDGWIASTTPGRLPWNHGPAPTPEAYDWELYWIGDDYSQARDLAAEYPEKLAAMKARFEDYAAAHNINPVDNNLAKRMPRKFRPYLTNGRADFEYFPSERRYADQEFPDVKGLAAWSVTAEVEISETPAEGTIISQGGFFGGWGVFCRGGHVEFVYRGSHSDAHVYRVRSPEPLAPGPHEICIDLGAQGPQMGAGLDVSMAIDGNLAATGSVGRTVPRLFVYEGIGVGRNHGTGIEDVRAVPDRFTGTVVRVRLHARQEPTLDLPAAAAAAAL